MNNAQSIREFVELLNHQADFIGRLAEYEGELQQVVSARDWKRLESLLPEMNRIGEAVNELEERRNAMYNDIATAVGGAETFARIVSRLPQELRGELSGAYRRLKVAVLALQSRTNGMDAYIRATISTTRGVLQELYPEHTSRGYSRDGQGRFDTAAAVMVDRAL